MSEQQEKKEPDLLCDAYGKPHGDEFIRYLMSEAVRTERFEHAAIYRDELKRRGLKTEI